MVHIKTIENALHVSHGSQQKGKYQAAYRLNGKNGWKIYRKICDWAIG